MKARGHMALLSHFVILGLIISPALIEAKNQGGKVLRAPETRSAGNSQTMELLEGYLNTNPAGIGGPSVAIVDETALSSGGDDSGAFVDLGRSGNGEISVYIVRKGDTIGEIAEMFGVSTNTILWANDLKSKILKEGQELVILPISGVKHTVKSGDTLQSLANKYKADLDEIISYNNIPTGAKLAVGDTIIIPDGVVSGVSNSSGTVTSQTNVVSGYYIRPINGGRKSQGIHGHNGVDLASSIGTPIMASASGKVIVSRTGGYNGGYGTYVVVSHPNGTQTLYAHMSKNNVEVGEVVTQGQVIGSIGMTGKTTGPHVHFEVRGARNPF
ncbi:MAG: peptidoglycan DD-metalloendopeptidase family protein [bacterium]|nr:peptidoglycan DD-metalloendopeptidase family protein [bacterium]